MHKAEPFVPEPSASEVEAVIRKFKTYKLLDIDHTPAALIKAEGETLCSEIRKLIRLIWNKEELPLQWKESIVVPIHKKIVKPAVVIIEAYLCRQLHRKFYPTFLLSRLTP
jgi:hypothetical protein